jgi:hypothetical protein
LRRDVGAGFKGFWSSRAVARNEDKRRSTAPSQASVHRRKLERNQGRPGGIERIMILVPPLLSDDLP